jgi:hypothetical protein
VRDGLVDHECGAGVQACNLRDVTRQSQRGADRWTQERANPAISGFPKSLPRGWFKRGFPQQPQVDETNEREIREHAGQPGIPFETTHVKPSALRRIDIGVGQQFQQSTVKILARSTSALYLRLSSAAEIFSLSLNRTATNLG